MRELKILAAALVAIVISACGGGGGDSGSDPFQPTDPSNPGSGNATQLTLRLSASSINNTGAENLTATATAATAAGQAASGVVVTFELNSGATYTQATSSTDTAGQVKATVGIGSSASNRVVTVVARSGALAASAVFSVTGSALTATAIPAIVAPGSANNKVDFRLVDANGVAMANQDITVDAGTVGITTAKTGVNGDYSYVYTAPAAAGTLNITGMAGGVTNTQTIVISGSSTVPVAVGPINSASVSANPSVVSVNTDSTSLRTEIRALFVGANNAPIKNVRVRFDLDGDTNSVGGVFSTGNNVVYSDVNGIATTAYIPGTRASPTNGVTIRACYSTNDFSSCASAGAQYTRTTITVVSEPLSVSIGSNNVVIIPSANLTYRRQFVVLVVDSSGRAKPNVDIVPSVDLPYYFKGRYINPGAWTKGYFTGNAVVAARMPSPGCANEDLNRNGVLEGGEDLNGSGSIEPRKSDVTVTILGNGKTDENGSATVQIEYPQNVGSWAQMVLLVSATGVSGTEGRATWTEVLPVPGDVLRAQEAPPFITSPYGIRVSSKTNQPPMVGMPPLPDFYGRSGTFPTDPGYDENALKEACAAPVNGLLD